MANQERIPLIAFVGPEGSGKTTQAKLLAKELGVLYFSTGDKIREAAANDKTEFGDACRKMLYERVYLAPSRILKMLGERFSQNDVQKGIVLDGGFRTLEETEGFQEMLNGTGKKLSVLVIFLRVAWYQGIERMLEQRGRSDDDIKGSLSRLSEFSKDLGKRMSFIRRNKNWRFIMIVDGGKSIEEIHREILLLTKN